MLFNMDILPWNKNLLTRSVNFHGADLLSNLLSRHKEAIQNLDTNTITFRRFSERKEVLSRYIPNNEEVIQFIHHKAMQLFKTREKDVNSEVKDNKVLKDIHSCLPPLEYSMSVHPRICFDMFFRNVKKDDLLFGYIDDCPSERIYSMKILSTATPKHRYLKDCDVMAFMREEETDVESGYRDPSGRWKVNTPLITQVLVVEKVGDSTAILVGTKGCHTAMVNNVKIKLGKASNDCLSQSIMKMIGHKLPAYDRCLENVGAFHSDHLWKMSLDYLAQHFALDLKGSSTLMKLDIVPATFTPEDQYRLARCCVAEGVSYYRAGENDKALEALEAALSFDKYHVDALMAKGTLLANLGKIEEALEDFEVVLELKPDHKNARRYACESLIQLAESYAEEGQMFEAEEKYQQCLVINHENVAAREGLHKIGRPVAPLRRNTIPFQEKSVIDPYMNPEPPPIGLPSFLSNILPPPPAPTALRSLIGEPPAKKQYLGPSTPYQHLPRVQDLRELIGNKKLTDTSFSTYTTPAQLPQALVPAPTTLITTMTDESNAPYQVTLNPDVFAKLQDLLKPSKGSEIYPSKGSETNVPPSDKIVDKADKDAGKCRGGTKELHGSCVVEDGQICDQYVKGNCKFGASGHNCSKTHPRYCKTYLKKGECPNGWLFCAKGPHPLVCKNSLTFGICNFKGCSYLHLNKTKNLMCPSKLGSVGFIVNSVKRKLDIVVDDNGPIRNEEIRKKKQKPLHRHYWRKLWQLKMARVEMRSMKEMMLSKSVADLGRRVGGARSPL